MRFSFAYTVGAKQGYKIEYDPRSKLYIEQQPEPLFDAANEAIRENQPLRLFKAFESTYKFTDILQNLKQKEINRTDEGFLSKALNNLFFDADYVLGDAIKKQLQNMDYELLEKKSADVDRQNIYSTDNARIFETSIVTEAFMTKTIWQIVKILPDVLKYDFLREILKSDELSMIAKLENIISCDFANELEFDTKKEIIQSDIYTLTKKIIKEVVLEVANIVNKQMQKDIQIDNSSNIEQISSKSIFKADATTIESEKKSIFKEISAQAFKSAVSVFLNESINIYSDSKKMLYKQYMQSVEKSKGEIIGDFEAQTEISDKKEIGIENESEVELEKIQNIFCDLESNPLFYDIAKNIAELTTAKQFELIYSLQKYIYTELPKYLTVEKIQRFIQVYEPTELSARMQKDIRIDDVFGTDSVFVQNIEIDAIKQIEKSKLDAEVERLGEDTLILIAAELYKQDEELLKSFAEIFVESQYTQTRQDVIIELAQDNNFMSLYRQFWFLKHTDPADWILLPYDYNDGEGHPIPEGAELGLDKIPVSIEIMIDFINILLFLLAKFRNALAGYTGVSGVKSFVNVVHQWVTLETSRQSEAIQDYDRCFRWLRWEAEKVINLAADDEGLTGYYRVETVIIEMVRYMTDHYFDIMPMFKAVEKMDEMRNIFDDPQNDIPFIINKIKAIKNMILGG